MLQGGERIEPRGECAVGLTYPGEGKTPDNTENKLTNVSSVYSTEQVFPERKDPIVKYVSEKNYSRFYSRTAQSL